MIKVLPQNCTSPYDIGWDFDQYFRKRAYVKVCNPENSLSINNWSESYLVCQHRKTGQRVYRLHDPSYKQDIMLLVDARERGIGAILGTYEVARTEYYRTDNFDREKILSLIKRHNRKKKLARIGV